MFQNQMLGMLANMMGASPDDMQKSFELIQQFPAIAANVIAHFNARLDHQDACLKALADHVGATLPERSVPNALSHSSDGVSDPAP